MRHASSDDLKTIESLLVRLDDLVFAHKALKSPKRGIYYLKSKAFLHFHEDDGGIYADVRLDGMTFDRFDVSAKALQNDLVDKVEGMLTK